MLRINITIPIFLPDFFYPIGVFTLLEYRRLRYGYTFRKIKLTRGKYAIVDPEDYWRLSQYKWYCGNKFYAKRTVTINGKQKDILMHKVICPVPEGMIVDHINGNTLDNRKVNLRPATNKQNRWNSKKNINGKSKYKGLSWDPTSKSWRVRIVDDGRKIHLGKYKDEIEAAKVYDKAAKKYRGQYARLNFPDD